MDPIVLAYSGGPQSSAAIPWLATTHRAEVVALTLDLGQGGDLEQVRDRALAGGAVRAHVLDVREEFARGYLVPALNAGALYDGGRCLATLLGRPLIASRLAEIASIERATTVAHGSPADRDRMRAAMAALAPSLAVLAPSAAAEAIRPERVVSIERPLEPASVRLTFERGTPTALNDVAMPLLDLIGSLDILAGAHGVGAADGLETPAVHVLASAHAELQARVTPPDVLRVARQIGAEYVGVIETGGWFDPLRTALDAFVGAVQQRVTGRVRLTLFSGACTVVDVEELPLASAHPRTAAQPIALFPNAKA